jgi:Xaa-Pro aminopeptidase
MFSAETYKERRNALRSLMISKGMVIIPGNGEAPANYPNNGYRFRQDSTFLYFFGLNIPYLYGVIDLDSGEDMLFGDDFSVDDIIWMGTQPSVKDLGERTGVANTDSAKKFDEIVFDATRRGRRIHFLPPYRADKTLLISSATGLKPVNVKDCVSVELALAVVSLRSIKSSDEIAQIEDACEIGYTMHTTAMNMCRPGVTEREIAGTMEGIALKYGAGVAFHSIVSQNGETLHNHNHEQTLADGRMLLVDAGAETTTNYCGDHTRTIPVSGKFTTLQREIYEIVLAANDKGFELSAPGMLYKDIHLAACGVIVDGLKDLGIMKGDTQEALDKGAHALLMPHGLGHMMGLDVHDMEDIGEKYVGYDLETERSAQLGLSSLRMGRRLQPGMVMTVEPGIYFIPALIDKWKNEDINTEFVNFDALERYENFGGIRIEDDILITEGGNRMLGKRRIPATVNDIEEFMSQKG